VFNIERESNIIINVHLVQRRNSLNHGGVEDREKNRDIRNLNITNKSDHP
jgi:hypothetical protein